VQGPRDKEDPRLKGQEGPRIKGGLSFKMEGRFNLEKTIRKTFTP
jgi:hypothetical protein